jgi:hypothetical protein
MPDARGLTVAEIWIIRAAIVVLLVWVHWFAFRVQARRERASRRSAGAFAAGSHGPIEPR